MIIDEVENSEEYKQIEKELDERIRLQLKFMGYDENMMGICHIYWNLKKEILESEYGINWKSPEELNPDILFD